MVLHVYSTVVLQKSMAMRLRWNILLAFLQKSRETGKILMKTLIASKRFRRENEAIDGYSSWQHEHVFLD